jgi:hypothetical protein
MRVDCKAQGARRPEAAFSANGNCFRHPASKLLIAYMRCSQLSLQAAFFDVYFRPWLAGVELFGLLAENPE